MGGSRESWLGHDIRLSVFGHFIRIRWKPKEGFSTCNGSEDVSCVEGVRKASGGNPGVFSALFQIRGAHTGFSRGFTVLDCAKAYWKNPKTAWRYMRLMEVVAPGSEGASMVQGVTEDQY